MARVEMRYEAMELDEILQGASRTREERRTEGLVFGMPIFREWEEGKDPAKETGKD